MHEKGSESTVDAYTGLILAFLLEIGSVCTRICLEIQKVNVYFELILC
jgi:hypothetical protein